MSKINTTDVEIKSYYIVKSLLIDTANIEDIVYKDNETYFTISGNTRKPICRIVLDIKKKHIFIPDENKDYIQYYIDSINDIYNYKDLLIAAVSNFINN
jgi:hypothetical protein